VSRWIETICGTPIYINLDMCDTIQVVLNDEETYYEVRAWIRDAVYPIARVGSLSEAQEEARWFLKRETWQNVCLLYRDTPP
jgi:hypothetical protein